MQRPAGLNVAPKSGGIPAPLSPINTPGYYQQGVAGSVPFTQLTPDSMNSITEEICTIIEGAGITLQVGVYNQLQTALNKTFLSNATGNIVLNVSTSGNDTTGTGTSGNPFATINGAYQYLCNTYNLGNYSATIQVANGSYTQFVEIISVPNGYNGSVAIVGNTGSPSSVTLNCTNDTVSGVFNINNANISISGFTLVCNVSNTLGGGNLVSSGTGAEVSVSNCIFGAYTNCGVIASVGSQIGVGSNISVASGVAASSLLRAHATGTVTSNGISINLGTGVSFSSATAVADECGVIEAVSLAWTGTNSTGPRYAANSNGVINTGGGGANYFVGNSAGSVANGGVYI